MITNLMNLQLLTETGLLLLPNIRAHCRADHLDATAVCCLALFIADCVMVSALVTDDDEFQCHVYLLDMCGRPGAVCMLPCRVERELPLPGLLGRLLSIRVGASTKQATADKPGV